MKKVLAVVLLCLPGFGQSMYSGPAGNPGADLRAIISSGAPLTYGARTDTCVTGAEAGCVAGRTTGEAGSALSFMLRDSDAVPFQQVSSGNANTNNCFTDPDFGSYNCFVTDQAFQANTTTWSMGSDGGYDAFNKDSTLLIVANAGSVTYLVDVVPSRFHAHTCAPSPSSAQCFVKSQIHGSASPDSTHFDTNAALAFSRNPVDGSTVMYEGSPTQINKLTITVPKDGNGTPTGADTITRTLIVDFTADTPVPCKVLPSDYQSTWNGGFSPSIGGAFTMASSGGGSYQTIGNGLAGAQTITSDTFIRPVNNQPAGSSNWMFQASNGTTSGTEPIWKDNCPNTGDTCTDGTVTWTNIGKISGQGPGFDVVSYDPSSGCSRVNTRLGKIYRGTGNPDPAGTMLTDDKMTCDRLGTSAPCPMQDTFGLHATSQQMDNNFATMGATGAGGANGQFPGVGSCVDSGMKFQGAWASGNSYAYHDFVYDPSDPGHNWWDSKHSGNFISTIAPHLDATNWANDNNLCYGYIWQRHTLMVRPLIGVTPPSGVSGGGFSTDGHNVGGYLYTFRGGKFFAHSYGKPTCDDATAPCLYEGAANPGFALMPQAICSDGHPTYRNDGVQDLQPIFDPVADVPAWPNRYVCAGYEENIAFTTDGNQTLYRFGHSYNSGSNAGFGIQNGIGVISQQGDMMAYSTDAMNSRGDRVTGAVTCANKLRGMYTPAPSQAVNYLDTMLPVTHNSGLDVYQAVGCPNNGGTTTCTESSNPPSWDAGCPNQGDYCTSDKTITGTPLDNNVVWLNLGPNTCRGDVVVMDPLSVAPAP